MGLHCHLPGLGLAQTSALSSQVAGSVVPWAWHLSSSCRALTPDRTTLGGEPKPAPGCPITQGIGTGHVDTRGSASLDVSSGGVSERHSVLPQQGDKGRTQPQGLHVAPLGAALSSLGNSTPTPARETLQTVMGREAKMGPGVSSRCSRTGCYGAKVTKTQVCWVGCGQALEDGCLGGGQALEDGCLGGGHALEDGCLGGEHALKLAAWGVGTPWRLAVQLQAWRRPGIQALQGGGAGQKAEETNSELRASSRKSRDRRLVTAPRLQCARTACAAAPGRRGHACSQLEARSARGLVRPSGPELPAGLQPRPSISSPCQAPQCSPRPAGEPGLAPAAGQPVMLTHRCQACG